MQLEPGPIADLPPLAISATLKDTTFLQLAIEAERENGASDDEIGLLVDAAWAALIVDPRGQTDQDLWDAEAGAETSMLGDLPDALPDMTAAAVETDELMLTAFKNVPQEAYSEPPAAAALPSNPPTFESPDGAIDAPQIERQE